MPDALPLALRCPRCPAVWVYPPDVYADDTQFADGVAIATPEAIAVLARIGTEWAAHVRDVHGAEELALRMERHVVHRLGRPA